MNNFAIFDDYLIEKDKRDELATLAETKFENKDLRYQTCGLRGFFNLNKRVEEYASEFMHGNEGGYENWCNILIDKLMVKFNIPKQDYTHSRHFIGVNKPTAFVAPHVDEKQYIKDDKFYSDDFFEARFNTFLKVPEGGGEFIVYNERVGMTKDKACVFDASIPHWTTPVEGNTTRVVLSISASIHKKHREHLFSHEL